MINLSLLLNTFITKSLRHEASSTIPSGGEMEIDDELKPKRRRKNKNN